MLLSKQLLDESTLEQIQFVALRLVIYHLKPWFTSMDPTLAACVDLELHRSLKK